MGRAPCCDKANVKRGPWSPEEDATLRSYVERNGTGGNWIALPQKAGLRRCGKSCRLRWLNYLRPDIKHGGFTEEEDNIIYTLFKNIGSRWSVIASHLPGRTDNDVKNYWNTKLKKRLMASQQPANPSPSPTTHNPSPPAAAPSLPPLLPSVKAEDFSGTPFDWGFAFGQDAYRFISDLPPFPIPADGLTACRPAEIANTTADNSSAGSSSVDNWSAPATVSSRGGDYFLSELGFDSYIEFLGGYGEVAPLIYQRVTNYS